MESFLSTVFGWSAARTREYMGDQTALQVLTRLLESTSPPNDVPFAVFRRVRPQLYRRSLQERLAEWPSAPQQAEIVAQLSIFELETVLRVNPFYLMFAFNVPFLECHRVLQIANMAVSDGVAAHAALHDLLLQNGAMFVDAAHTTLAARGVRVTESLDKAFPFPPDHLAGHPLLEADPDATSSAYLKSLLPNQSSVISSIRERKYMMNRIVVVHGRYKLRTRSVMFADEVMRVRDRSRALESRVRRAYKKLKREG